MNIYLGGWGPGGGGRDCDSEESQTVTIKEPPFSVCMLLVCGQEAGATRKVPGPGVYTNGHLGPETPSPLAGVWEIIFLHRYG